MTIPTLLEIPAVRPDSHQSSKLEFLAVGHLGEYSYSEAIAQLKDCGHLSLLDMQELSCTDLNYLFEEIKYWCVYGNHEPKKLRSEPLAGLQR